MVINDKTIELLKQLPYIRDKFQKIYDGRKRIHSYAACD